MKKICDIILVLLIIVAIVVGIMILEKYLERQKNEEKLSEIVKQVESINTDDENIQIPTIDGYEIEGIIEIPKIQIKYPIINKTNDNAMKVSITKFWGERSK